MRNLNRMLLAVTLVGAPALKAQAAVLTIGANCAFKHQIASLFFDTETRRLVLDRVNLDDDYDWSRLMSEPITVAPEFADRENPLRVSDGQRSAQIVFGTKNSVEVTSDGVKRSYSCSSYFPQQLGMEY